MNQDKQTDEDREFREWCIAAASSADGSASITARNAWNARAALANLAVGAYLGKMTLRDRDAAMDASLNDLQTAAYAEGRKDEREESGKDAARYRWLRDHATDGDWRRIGEIPALSADRIDEEIDDAIARMRPDSQQAG